MLAQDVSVFYFSVQERKGGNMWFQDWLDTAVVVGWIGAWSALVYLLPLAGF